MIIILKKEERFPYYSCRNFSFWYFCFFPFFSSIFLSLYEFGSDKFGDNLINYAFLFLIQLVYHSDKNTSLMSYPFANSYNKIDQLIMMIFSYSKFLMKKDLIEMIKDEIYYSFSFFSFFFFYHLYIINMLLKGNGCRRKRKKSFKRKMKQEKKID